MYQAAANGAPEALPQVLDDTTLRDYQVKLADLERQYAELNSMYTPAHPLVKRLAAQIADLKATAQRRSTNILGRIHGEYAEALRAREDAPRHVHEPGAIDSRHE